MIKFTTIFVIGIFYLTHPWHIGSQSIKTPDNNSESYAIEITKVRGSIEWETLNFELEISLKWNNSPELAYQMPQVGRNFLDSQKKTIITNFAKRVPYTQGMSVMDYATKNNIALVFLRFVYDEALTIHSIPTKNLMGFTEIIRIPIAESFRRVLLPQYETLSIPTVLNPSKNANRYTSLVFFLAESMPHDGSDLYYIPKLFPTVYSEQGTLVYSPRYVDEEKVPYKYIEAPDSSMLGAAPRIVYAVNLDSDFSGDPIILKEDAQEILSNDSLRQHIKMGNVFFWVHSTDATFALRGDND